MKTRIERLIAELEDCVEQDTQWLTRSGQDSIRIKIEELKKELQKQYN